MDKYGPIDKSFSANMFTPSSHLGLIMHEALHKPNSKQLGLSHYCLGNVRKCQRQLWNVPSGQGKSRIMAFVALIALKTKMFPRVYLVFDNDHLKDRDKSDFESLWTLLQLSENISYHVGCNFNPDPNSLVLFDESDSLMFD